MGIYCGVACMKTLALSAVTMCTLTYFYVLKLHQLGYVKSRFIFVVYGVQNLNLTQAEAKQAFYEKFYFGRKKYGITQDKKKIKVLNF